MSEILCSSQRVGPPYPHQGCRIFNLIPLLFTGAFAAAVVGLAESSGAGAAYPNPDGTRSPGYCSLDFSGQGLGNIAGSFFQAMPAGGSLFRTGINASGGARSRWAGVYSGLLITIVLMLFGHFAELIPMAGLAGLLIVIGFDIMFREGRELAEAWNISRLNTVVAVITILVGVFSDLTVAIFTGVFLSLLLYTFSSANKFKIVKLRQARGWGLGNATSTRANRLQSGNGHRTSGQCFLCFCIFL